MRSSHPFPPLMLLAHLLLAATLFGAQAGPQRGEPPPDVEQPDQGLPVEAPDAGPSEEARRKAGVLTRRAMQLLGQHKWEAAEAALEEALSLVPQDPVNLYNLACARSRMGRRDAAMDALENAAAAGFTDFVLLIKDPDLEPLHALPRFKSLVANKEQWQRRAAEATVEALRQRFGDDYLYSVDFDLKLIFATNVDEQTLAELKEVLRNQAQGQHAELFEHRPDAFVTVVVPSARDYRRLVQPANVGGMYLDGSKTLIAQRPGEAMRHEFTHALHAGDRAPLGQDHAPWVAEGLGVMYEAADVGDGSITPRPDGPRYLVARAAARRRSLIPLERLVKMDAREFLSRPNITYAESGSLMFYLRERGVLRKFYEAYKKTYEADPTAVKALGQASGQSLAEFEAAWKQWLLDKAADADANDPRRGYTPFLGLSLRPTPDGLAVAAVEAQGPGHLAGLEVGDVLLSINGRAVKDYTSLRPAIGSYAPGKKVTLKFRRDGADHTTTAELRRPARPAERG